MANNIYHNQKKLVQSRWLCLFYGAKHAFYLLKTLSLPCPTWAHRQRVSSLCWLLAEPAFISIYLPYMLIFLFFYSIHNALTHTTMCYYAKHHKLGKGIMSTCDIHLKA